MLYISVLKQQGKYESALEVMTGQLGELFSIQNDKLRLQVTHFSAHTLLMLQGY